MLFCFVYWAGNKLFVLLNGPVAEWLRLADGRQKMFLHEKGACENDMKTFSLQLDGFA